MFPVLNFSHSQVCSGTSAFPSRSGRHGCLLLLLLSSTFSPNPWKPLFFLSLRIGLVLSTSYKCSCTIFVPLYLLLGSLLVYVSLLMWVQKCFDYCSFAVNWNQEIRHSFGYLGSLEILLFFLLCLQFSVLYWLEVLKAGILVFSLILRGKFSVFNHWRWCLLWVF